MLRIGVIGLGRAGWTHHTLPLAQHPLCRVTAVADPVPERVAEAVALTGCRGHDSYRDLLADASVDVAVVATPTHTHAAITLEALAAGKHVVVEKLMATSVAEADAMIAAARRAGKVLTVFQNARLNRQFVRVQEIIAGGRIGKVTSIRMGKYWYNRRTDWQTLHKYGGGVLNVHGAHLVDLALLLAPGARVCYADLRRNVSAGDAEDHAKVVMRTPEGVVIDVELFQDCAVNHETWLITGEHGAIRVEGGVVTVRWCDPATLVPLQVDEGPAAGRKYAHEQVAWQQEQETPEIADATPAWYSALHASIREGAPLLVTPESVRAQLAVLTEARQKAAL